MKVTILYLQWYRDKGKGQEAYDFLAKHRLYKRRVTKDDGAFPIARLFLNDATEYEKFWQILYTKFQVNSMMVHADRD